jgi:hypothetical protein
MLDGSTIIVVGEVDHHSKLYTFSHFVPKYDYVMLLTHVNEESILWHEIVGHLKFRYLQQINKKGMVNGIPNIKFKDGVYQGCILGKHPKEKFDKRNHGEHLYPLSSCTMMAEVASPTHPLLKLSMFLISLMIGRDTHGSIFSNSNLKFLSVLDISRNL